MGAPVAGDHESPFDEKSRLTPSHTLEPSCEFAPCEAIHIHWPAAGPSMRKLPLTGLLTESEDNNVPYPTPSFVPIPDAGSPVKPLPFPVNKLAVTDPAARAAPFKSNPSDPSFCNVSPGNKVSVP